MKTLKIFILIFGLSLISIITIQIRDIKGLDISDQKWKWIYSKIYHTPRQDIDYVFIGSSRTWCAVKSNQIEKALGVKKVWNFGRHWIGRDIDYFIIKSLLRRHNVKNIMVEIIGQENFFPHQYTQYIISPDEVLNEIQFHFSKIGVKDIFFYNSNFKERIKHLTNYVTEISIRLYRKPLSYVLSHFDQKIGEDSQRAVYDKNGGFYVFDQTVKQNPIFYSQFRNFQPTYPVWKGPFVIPMGTYPDYYISKIKQESEQDQTNLSFVFISDFAAVLPHDQMFHYFNRLGDVYIPTLRNVYKLEYWRDKNHVFQEGSVAMTSEIIFLIQNGVESSEDYQQYGTK